MNKITDGHLDLPPGKIASIVTALEMHSAPDTKSIQAKSQWQLERIENPKTDWYRNLYRKIGEPWLWFSRLKMTEQELKSIITNPKVSIYAFRFEGKDEGLLELDFRQPGECELAFLGLTKKLTGKGIGRWIMQMAHKFAWEQDISRFWVHTCTLDGPGALAFYMSSGFRAYKRQIEIADDPRHLGIYSRQAAPEIPLL